MTVQFIPARFTSANVPTLITTTVGALAGLILAVALWFIGAASTITFATVVIPALTGLSGSLALWYGIAVVFSAIEIWDARTADDGSRSWLKQLAVSVKRIDMATTILGLFIITTQRFLPPLGVLIANLGIVVVWTDPNVVIACYVVSALLSILFGRWITLRPELIMIEAVAQLWQVVKYVYLALRGKSIAITVASEKGTK